MIKARRGFSVMETLVSVALLSIAIIPLISLQQTLASSAARIQQVSERLEAQQSAIAYLESIDPYASPNGEIAIGEWTLRWQAQPIAHEPNADGFLGTGLYDITLFQINAVLSRDGQETAFEIRRVGWIQSRSIFSG